MPPLDEGTLLYMPTTMPGISISQAQQILQVSNRILKQFPEVDHVLGKAGRAETPTDPAPLSMIETLSSIATQARVAANADVVFGMGARVDKSRLAACDA